MHAVEPERQEDGFGRSQRFDARNPLATSKDALTQSQYGATLGGPLRPGRSFLFTNFEQGQRQYSTVVTIDPSAVAIINSKLQAVRYSGPFLSTGLVPASFDTTNLFIRADHQINQRNHFSIRYSLYRISAENSRTVGGLNAASRSSGLEDTDQTVQLSNVTVFSKTMNEARLQFTRSRLHAPVNDLIGPAVTIAGIANFGTAISSPTERDLTMIEGVENVSLQHDSHSTKVGVDFLLNRLNIVFPGAIQGSYNFTSLNNFLAGNYSTYQQAFGKQSQFQSNPNVGFFVQDEWQAQSNLTFNLGLRYDIQFLSEQIQNDVNNIAPRVGVAYAPGDQKTVFRANAGLYFDRLPLRATSNALQRDGSQYVVVQFAPIQTAAPVFPNNLSSQPTSLVTKPNVTRIDPNIESSYSLQASLQLERELPGNIVLSAGYLHLRGLHLILSRNVNVSRFPASAGIPNLGRPDPNWGNISRYESSGNSYYDGLVVSFNKRAGDWSKVRVSYTFSKSIDDAGNFFFSSPQNNFDVSDDRGLSDNDQRHRLVVSGLVQVPNNSHNACLKQLYGFDLSYIFTYASNPPFNILLGSDRNFDTNNNDRPLGIGRNTGDGFDYASLDLRLRRTIRLTERVQLQVLAEGFNLLNKANFTVPNGTRGSSVTPLPSFGKPTATFDPRQFQFGLRLNF